MTKKYQRISSALSRLGRNTETIASMKTDRNESKSGGDAFTARLDGTGVQSGPPEKLPFSGPII